MLRNIYTLFLFYLLRWILFLVVKMLFHLCSHYHYLTRYQKAQIMFNLPTGKSLSEALIFASTNPQYDNRLFIDFQVQYIKIPSSNLGRTCCVQKLFQTFRTIFVHNMFSPCSAKRRASDKDLPVQMLTLISLSRVSRPRIRA